MLASPNNAAILPISCFGKYYYVKLKVYNTKDNSRYSRVELSSPFLSKSRKNSDQSFGSGAENYVRIIPREYPFAKPARAER